MAWIGAPYKDHNQLELFTCSQALVGADKGLAGDLPYWYTVVVYRKNTWNEPGVDILCTASPE